MKNFLIKIVKALVDNPEQVQVNEVEGSQIVVLELRVDKSDMGKIIGKQGRTANSIRALLNAASGKAEKRYVLEIVE
ncbi:MAG: KH domain-containing protein [Desulfobacteraceae bacterium]|nr:KH domain-containing protein [Desulfobacteraceae bacterium]MDH3574612.1 KH domain-containing protein [Desulfobacteraceae bacterium]MDH3721849.1 KH domain-containing protein [Desulfobacteraceae bacterium]MDH3837675.1 KH domain-containing protein [Desulfobacteraceae bacterium]MDH3873463.1 KH domain-containing protein [Desulfobacteraceae bacterium]